MSELKQGRNFVILTGKVKINDKSFSGLLESKKSDWQYVRINLGVETAEGNVVYAQMMGGYSPSNPILYAFNKEQGQDMLQINWEDRFNEKILESVARNSFFEVGLETKEGSDEYITKQFLSPIDAEDYIKEHLEDGMEVTITGNMSYQEYNGEIQRNIEIRSIKIPYKNKKGEVKYQAKFTQTILLDEDSYKKITKADEKEGEIIIPAKVVQYVGKPIRKNMPFAVGITVKIDDVDKVKKVADKLFKVKKGKIREIVIEGDIVEGYDQEEVDENNVDFPDDIQELIDMGLYSEEEARSKMIVRGNRVSKLVFTRPFVRKVEVDGVPKLTMEIDDEKYKPDDLIVSTENAGIDDIEEESLDEEEETDSSWMEALGI